MPETKRLEFYPVADHHVHPDYSMDAEGSIDDYCKEAFRIGLTDICFTTHYDADPVRLDMDGVMIIDGQPERVSEETVGRYFEDIARAHDEYGQIGIMVKGGLEVGFYPGCERQVAELRAKFPVAHCVGAVHGIGDLSFCEKEQAQKLFATLTLTQMANAYFEQLDRCVATGQFDCLAHIDMYRRFGLDYYGPQIFAVHRGRIEKVFETMIATDTGFELNTSAIRHGHKEYYPSMTIVNAARAAGVRLLTLGSDAHRPQDLALDFEAASAVAYELMPYVDE